MDRQLLSLLPLLILLQVSLSMIKLASTSPTRAPNEWALAAKHNQRILQYARCSKPFPRVINVHGELRSSASKKYIPHCTVLHFCGEHSGCCQRETETCVPAKTEEVKLYFVTIEFTSKGYRKGIEVITMQNHTECHCAPINAQNSRKNRSQVVALSPLNSSSPTTSTTTSSSLSSTESSSKSQATSLSLSSSTPFSRSPSSHSPLSSPSSSPSPADSSLTPSSIVSESSRADSANMTPELSTLPTIIEDSPGVSESRSSQSSTDSSADSQSSSLTSSPEPSELSKAESKPESTKPDKSQSESFFSRLFSSSSSSPSSSLTSSSSHREYSSYRNSGWRQSSQSI